jgi:uncharacterized phosphosugar-binding protein
MDHDEEIILERTVVGSFAQVRAVAADGLEVAFTAPVNAAPVDVARLARQKLAFVRARSSVSQPAQTARRGLIV